MKLPTNSFDPTRSQRRQRKVQSIDGPDSLFSWLRERYIARKTSAACGASSTETVESSDSDTRTARSRSTDHEEAGSIFRVPRKSIFFVTTGASFGTRTSSRGMSFAPKDVVTDPTGVRGPDSQRDQSAPQLEVCVQVSDITLQKCVGGSQTNDLFFGSLKGRGKQEVELLTDARGESGEDR